MNHSTDEKKPGGWWQRLSVGPQADVVVADHRDHRPRHQAQARPADGRGDRGGADPRRSRHHACGAVRQCRRRGPLRQDDHGGRGEGDPRQRSGEGAQIRRQAARDHAAKNRSSCSSSASTDRARRRRSASSPPPIAAKAARSCWPRATRSAPRRSSSSRSGAPAPARASSHANRARIPQALPSRRSPPRRRRAPMCC